jgi:hypothetical protein
MDTKIEASENNKSIPYMIVHALVKIFEMNDINIDLHQMSKIITDRPDLKKKYCIIANWKCNGTTDFVRDIVTNLINDLEYDT